MRGFPAIKKKKKKCLYRFGRSGEIVSSEDLTDATMMLSRSAAVLKLIATHLLNTKLFMVDNQKDHFLFCNDPGLCLHSPADILTV